MTDEAETQKSKKKKSTFRKTESIIYLCFTLFALLILRLGIIQIVQGEEFKLQVEKTAVESVNYSVPRGVMYDRNYNKVVYNVPQKAITFTAPKNPQPNELLKIATDLAKYIEMTDLDKKKVTVRDKKDIWLLQHENGQGKVSKREEKSIVIKSYTN